MEKSFKIFSYGSEGEIAHEIVFPFEALVASDGQIVIELPDFYWQNHAETCEDCKAFQNSFGQNDLKWLIQIDDDTYFLNLKGFSTKDDYFKNLCQLEASSEFTGTRFKFNYKKLTDREVKDLLDYSLNTEDYETCASIRNYFFAKT